MGSSSDFYLDYDAKLDHRRQTKTNKEQQRATKNNKEHQITTKNNKEQQRTTKNNKDKQRTTKNNKETQRKTETKTDSQTDIAIAQQRRTKLDKRGQNNMWQGKHMYIYIYYTI